MPRYYFDLVDPRTVADQGGQDLPDYEAAKYTAAIIAKRLAAEQPQLLNRHFAIVATAQNGEEICRVPLDPIY